MSDTYTADDWPFPEVIPYQVFLSLVQKNVSNRPNDKLTQRELSLLRQIRDSCYNSHIGSYWEWHEERARTPGTAAQNGPVSDSIGIRTQAQNQDDDIEMLDDDELVNQEPADGDVSAVEQHDDVSYDVTPIDGSENTPRENNEPLLPPPVAAAAKVAGATLFDVHQRLFELQQSLNAISKDRSDVMVKSVDGSKDDVRETVISVVNRISDIKNQYQDLRETARQQLEGAVSNFDVMVDSLAKAWADVLKSKGPRVMSRVSTPSASVHEHYDSAVTETETPRRGETFENIPIVDDERHDESRALDASDLVSSSRRMHHNNSLKHSTPNNYMTNVHRDVQSKTLNSSMKKDHTLRSTMYMTKNTGAGPLPGVVALCSVFKCPNSNTCPMKITKTPHGVQISSTVSSHIVDDVCIGKDQCMDAISSRINALLPRVLDGSSVIIQHYGSCGHTSCLSIAGDMVSSIIIRLVALVRMRSIPCEISVQSTCYNVGNRGMVATDPFCQIDSRTFSRVVMSDATAARVYSTSLSNYLSSMSMPGYAIVQIRINNRGTILCLFLGDTGGSHGNHYINSACNTTAEIYKLLKSGVPVSDVCVRVKSWFMRNTQVELPFGNTFVTSVIDAVSEIGSRQSTVSTVIVSGDVFKCNSEDASAAARKILTFCQEMRAR